MPTQIHKKNPTAMPTTNAAAIQPQCHPRAFVWCVSIPASYPTRPSIPNSGCDGMVRLVYLLSCNIAADRSVRSSCEEKIHYASIMKLAYMLTKMDGNPTVYRSCLGDDAVLIFSSNNSAGNFMRHEQECTQTPMQLVELTPQSVQPWLDRMAAQGIHYGILNAPPGKEGKCAPACKLTGLFGI